MNTILVLHGPNLNLLGHREPEYYGAMTLSDIDQQLQMQARASNFELMTFQSNSESELISRIHNAQQEDVKFILFNPAALTHTSIALRDALLAVNIPFIEIHLSNIHAREQFRQQSFFSDIAHGVICGLGPQSYFLALSASINFLES